MNSSADSHPRSEEGGDASQYFGIVLDQLPIDVVPNHPICDEHGAELVAAQTPVTLGVIQSLRGRQVRRVYLHCQDRIDWGLPATSTLLMHPPQRPEPSAIWKVARDIAQMDLESLPVPLLELVRRGISEKWASPTPDDLAIGSFMMAVPVFLWPVTAQWHLNGTPARAVVHSISATGIGFVNPHALPKTLVAILLPTGEGKIRPMIVQVESTRVLGRYYDSVGRFMARLEME